MEEDARDDGSAVDLQVLRDMIGDDHDLFQELIDLFIDDCDARIAGLPTVVAAADPKQVQKAAHYLKGVSANVGARALTHNCALLERLALEGWQDESEMLDLAARITAEYGRVRRALQPQADDGLIHRPPSPPAAACSSYVLKYDAPLMSSTQPV